MWHFKGEKRVLRDRHIREAKEWKRWFVEWLRKQEESREKK